MDRRIPLIALLALAAAAGATTPHNEAAIRADLNRDGVVDQKDLRLFLETRRSPASGTVMTDINGDGALDAADLAALLAHIAEGSRPGASAPEAVCRIAAAGGLASIAER